MNGSNRKGYWHRQALASFTNPTSTQAGSPLLPSLQVGGRGFRVTQHVSVMRRPQAMTPAITANVLRKPKATGRFPKPNVRNIAAPSIY